jgi:dihydroflavonol-4-reductase
MNVLVFGASGYLGGHVVQALLDTGHRVTAGVRNARGLDFGNGDVRFLAGDLHDSDYVRESLSEQEAVVFAAGRTWSPEVRIDEYVQSNVAITRSFFEAATAHRGVRIIFTSSLSTIGGTREPVALDETSDRANVCQSRLNPYDLAKIECERIARDAAGSGQNVVILNPGLMIGPGAAGGSKLPPPFIAVWVLLGKCPILVDSLITFSDVRDVANGHVAALVRGRSGERYILGGHNQRRSEYYQQLAEWTGTPCPRSVPNACLTGLAWLTDGLQGLTAGLLKSPVHRRFARSQSLHYCGESGKAMSELGYEARPLSQTVLQMLRQEVERERLPSQFAYLKGVTVENAREMLLLRQLARAGSHADWWLPRLPRLLEACRHNDALSAALQKLAAASQFDPRRARFRWPRGSCSAETNALQQFLEHTYFSSDEFLQGVL